MVMDAPTPADSLDAEREGDIVVLRELVEIGLDLARVVAELSKTRIAEATVSGWDGNIPKDPGEAFVRLAQSVRRSIALKAKLLEGFEPDSTEGASGPGASRIDAPFASSGPPLDLTLDFARAARPHPNDRPIAEARHQGDRRDSLAADLGALHEPRETLLESLAGPIHRHIAERRGKLRLGPGRPRIRPDGVFVADPADSADLLGPAEVPSSAWRRDGAAFLHAGGWPKLE